MRRQFALIIAALSLASVPLFGAWSHASEQLREERFTSPIDGLSVEGDMIDAQVSGLDGSQWTSWKTLTIDTEDDPDSHESDLVLFPHPVSAVRLRGATPNVTIHPIRISQTAPGFHVAATGLPLVRPRILSRSDWGADDSLLYTSAPPSSSSAPATNDTGPATDASGGSTPGRIKDCEEMQKLYPTEFHVSRTVNTDGQGRRYLWPQQYSPSIRLLVVHHTAMEVDTDSRPPVERMRALYQYHAKNRGWGDIGYHYVIDETGQIYQGKAGGEYVVGGHTYCNNISTLGIALMGNFEVEKPSQAQIASLQWLIDTLSKEYDIDLSRNVVFHGKTIPPVVGHRDLISTACPGYYAYGVLSQVLSHVRDGLLQASVTFPPPRSSSSSSKPSASPAKKPATQGLSPLGDTTIMGRPGGEMALALQYRAAGRAVRKGGLLGMITRSDPKIGVWVAKDNTFIRSRTTLLAPDAIAATQTLNLRVKISFPLDRGTYTLRIGPVTYTLISEGMRSRSALRIPTLDTYVAPPRASSSPSSYFPPSSSSSSSLSSSSAPAPSSPSNPLIRILLHDSSLLAPEKMTVSLENPATVAGQSVSSGNIELRKKNGDCIAAADGKDIASGIVRMELGDGMGRIASWTKESNRFRGVLECRVIEGSLSLIDELPLESYMAGLAEEPDSEPAEKQRAFAIAARSYAVYYLDAAHRKFPNQPYDGSDSPAEFQKFGGVAFEEGNPRWVQIVTETAGKVLKKSGQVLRVPYFSSDDGRTRSPSEAGWNNFPNAEVFASKPDPWCKGFTLAGHGVGMSGCGARGQAYEGKTGEQILQYYYPGAVIAPGFP